MRRTFVGIGLLVLLAGCGQSDTPPSPPSPPAPSPANGKTGTIVGVVKFVGKIPVSNRFMVNKDHQVCGQEKTSEEFVVGTDQGVRWAVISVKKDFNFVETRELKSVLLDQKGCQFFPHVLLARTGDDVKISNPDGVLHNFHTYSVDNIPVNKAQPGFKKEMRVSFEKPEIFRIGCDAHSWMSGWIAVFDHPFAAVSDEKGNFRIDGVPAGKRTLQIWHEVLGQVAWEIDVKPDAETVAVFKLSRGESPTTLPAQKVGEWL